MTNGNTSITIREFNTEPVRHSSKTGCLQHFPEGLGRTGAVKFQPFISTVFLVRAVSFGLEFKVTGKYPTWEY